MKIVRKLENSFFEPEETEESSVKEIIRDVRENGDDAVKKYSLKFDGVAPESLRVERLEIENAIVERRVYKAMEGAAENIRKFSEKQLEQFGDFEFEIAPGVFTGQKVTSIKRVGIYVPAGSHPLVSTLLMCAIPARVAGVKEIVVCSPPTHVNSVHPAILVGARMCEIDEVYGVGGAQAIAALAYGTQTIRKVDKIVGPGNRYVALAKKEVFGAVGIDLIAGPTEIMIIADESANEKILAIDLIAQAEHDPNVLPILVTPSSDLADRTKKEIYRELKNFPAAKRAIEKNGSIVLTGDIDEAIEIANRRAPEHLELQTRDAEKCMDKLKNYGSLFIGRNSAVAFGDYSSGINHTLPTNTGARHTSGLSVKDFIKLQTTLRVTKKGLKSMGSTAKTLAEIEGLKAHKISIDMRMEGE
jgi:histidinol dehydrogenase